jgi:hypothetical protein
MASTQELTQASLNEWFDYDGVTLSWKDKSRETKICFNAAGYPIIRFAKNARLIHRLVYLMWHGNLPKELDHINNDKTYYAISNLREATSSENKANKGAEKQNRSGYKGVCWDTKFQRWLVRVTKQGKVYRAVNFKSAEDAHEFACLMRDMIHGEFANHKGVLNCLQQ